MSWEDDIRHVPGIWFSKGGGSVVPIPPLAFFDEVPKDLEFGLCSLYPFTQPDVLRKLVGSHPEVLDYLEGHPMPGGTMERCLQWAAPIGRILFSNDYSLLYCNQLTTCHTDEVELKRAIAGLPQDVASHWSKDLLIHVCLGNDPDVQPVSRTWAELTMSHLTSGQRFAFSLPPVVPRQSTEPAVHVDAEEDEAEPVAHSGAKSAIQRELDEVTAGLAAEQEQSAHAPTTAPPSRTLPPFPRHPASSAPASPSRMAIHPLGWLLIGLGVIFCTLLLATHWQGSDRDAAETKRGNSDDPVARLVSMTPTQAYAHGYGQIRPQFDAMMAAVKDDLYPGSITNQMRRRGGGTELTPSNVAAEMRAACAAVEQDANAEIHERGKAAGISQAVVDAYLRGRLAGVAALGGVVQQTQSADNSPRVVAPSIVSPPHDTSLKVVQMAEQTPSGGVEGKQPSSSRQRSPLHWLAYGQNVTLHGTLLKQYHTEYLDTLPNSAEGRRRARTPAYILRLAAPISVRAADPDDAAFDPEQNVQEVYLSTLPEGTEKLMDALVGRSVTVVGKLDHAYTVHHPRPVMIDASAITGDQREEARPATPSPAELQKRLPNGAVADPYANYVAVRPQPAVQTPTPALAALSRVYTVPELKKLVGSRPAGAGLRGDFVLVRREGNQVLLQSRADLGKYGITSTTNGQEDVYPGHTFVAVTCSKDIGKFVNGQLVTIPAEQPLRIISVSKNSQDRIDVEASF